MCGIACYVGKNVCLGSKRWLCAFFGGCASGSSVNLDTRRLHYDEVKIISSFHHTPEYFRKALELISSGEISVDKLITKRMDMKYAKRAIEMHRDGEAIKILLEN